jgi:hypothetical protein
MDTIKRNILVIKKYRISNLNSTKKQNWQYMTKYYYYFNFQSIQI